jgi:hypothetical protein
MLLGRYRFLMDLELLLACFSVGRLGEDVLISWAVEALQSGRDGQALRELAGLVPVDRDRARPLFERAVQELGFHVPDTAEAVRIFARRIASEALAGSRDLMEATRELGDLAFTYGMEDRSLARWPDTDVNLYVFDYILEDEHWPAEVRLRSDRRTAWIREQMERILQAT